jgi:hypothetical protein
LGNQDAFTIAQIITELNSIPEPAGRVALLTALRCKGAYFGHELTGFVLGGESPKVRAWAAAHLDLNGKDYYSEYKNEKEAVDFGTQVRNDPDPVVRASMWSNENYCGVPWTMFRIPDNRKETFKEMTHLERLALMRNQGLSDRFIVALLDAPGKDLGMTRAEHAKVLYAGAVNTRIIWGSRRHGRDYWMVEGDVNPPSDEYGQMWNLSLDKWLDMGYIPYAFLKWVETTPKTKLAVYQRLLVMPEYEHPSLYRKAMIEGCDPSADREVLNLAWDDPDNDCKATARERGGRISKLGWCFEEA